MRGHLGTLLSAGLALLLCLAGSAGPARGDPAAFYSGKTISLVIGSGVGGGYDAYARFLAPHLERATGATVVIRNEPGASGIVALNKLVRRQPDGLTLMLVNGPAMTLAQFLDLEGVRFDLSTVTWIAGVASEGRALLLAKGLRLETLRSRSGGSTLRWGGTGKASGQTFGAALLSRALGLESRIILGFKGSRHTVAATLRREVDALVLSNSSARKFANSDLLHVAAVLGRERSPLLPHIPTIFERVELSEQGSELIDTIDAIARLGRSLVAPPATDRGRVRFLRAAFRKILTDPGIIAEARRIGRPLVYRPPERISARIEAFLKSPDPARISIIRDAIRSQID